MVMMSNNRYEGGFQILTPAAVNLSAGDNHNIDIINSVIALNPAADGDGVTGFISTNGNLSAGCMVWLMNTHATRTIILKHNNAGSTANFRINTQLGTNVNLPPMSRTYVVYLTVGATTGWFIPNSAGVLVFSLDTNITPAAIGASTTDEQTFTVTGLLTTDRVSVNMPGVVAQVGLAGARVTATNTLALNFVRSGGLLATNPPAGIYRITVTRGL